MNIRNYAMEPEIPDPNMYFEDGSHFELPRESEHIFNLEFDYNDINDVGEDDSIDGANSKNGSQQNSMSFDGSGDNLMTMDSKLNKFYRYIKARSNEFGKLVVEHISYHKQLMKTMLCLLNILVITIKQNFKFLYRIQLMPWTLMNLLFQEELLQKHLPVF